MTRSQQEPLWRFVAGQWLAHLPMIAGAVSTTLLATLVSVSIPLAAREVATYDGAARGGDGTRAPDSTSLTAVTAALGAFSERVFGPAVQCVVPLIIARTSSLTEKDTLFVTELMCRCLLMATLVLAYHAVSLGAHLAAYWAGISAQCSLVEHAVACILSRQHPARVAVVDPSRLTHMVLSSAKTSSDILGKLLTDVAASIFATIGTLAMLLFISAKLTLATGGMVALVQVVYIAAGRNHDRHAARVATQEAALSAQVKNAVARSETIFIFQSEGFVLRRLNASLRSLALLTGGLNASIHGYATLSTASTMLVFVVVLGMSTYYHRTGELSFSDSALYFMFLHSFVNRIVSMTTDLSRAWTDLGRLAALQRTLAWFTAQEEGEEDSSHDDGEEGRHAHGSVVSASENKASRQDLKLQSDEQPPPMPRVVLSDDPATDITISDVSFTYPSLPASLAEHLCSGVRNSYRNSADESEPNAASVSTATVSSSAGGRLNGVCGATLRAAAGRITALYGPSGCGKSTCLRLLAGVLPPASGEVRTHRRVVLLEQAHAIFLGSVAENVVLRELGWPSNVKGRRDLIDASEKKSASGIEKEQSEKDRVVHGLRHLVERALTQSGCNGFIADPYQVFVNNMESPPFSGGQLQRICLARVFAYGGGVGEQPCEMERRGTAGCTLVLLDEPTVGLDGPAVQQLLRTIVGLRDVHGMTVLIATHDERVAAIADSVVDMAR